MSLNGNGNGKNSCFHTVNGWHSLAEQLSIEIYKTVFFRLLDFSNKPAVIDRPDTTRF